MKRWILVLALLAGCEKDADGDGYNDEVDCNDDDASVYPGADDTWYDGVDSDCAGDNDFDQDQDGFTSSDHDGDDCNDTDGAIHPDATEVCDDVDNDCNGGIDDDASDGTTMYVDNDNDGYGVDTDTLITCETSVAGYATEAGDCNDGDETMSPGGTEVCDDKDNDCNDIVDDNATDAETWYTDSDSDGYGDPDTMETGCNPPAESVSNGDDCNDDYTEIFTCDSVYGMQDGTTTVDTQVVVDGLIVTGFNLYGAFIQHPDGGKYSAIWAYGGSGSTDGLTIGDVVSVAGLFTEYNDLTEIDFRDGWLIQQGTGTVPAPEVVTTSELADPTTAEPWESVLITVENVTVTDEDVGFGEWEITDSVRIDDAIFKSQEEFPNLAVGDAFESITGPLYFSYSAFKIEPRSADDFTGYMPIE